MPSGEPVTLTVDVTGAPPALRLRTTGIGAEVNLTILVDGRICTLPTRPETWSEVDLTPCLGPHTEETAEVEVRLPGVETKKFRVDVAGLLKSLGLEALWG
ncbi:hypothetical protein Val02_66830 [Virgisporangium aliadipatigenens]|uniref:Uncharacterized protein n=1 Tax=Virgisporangium aliadipatigenens TaxID=741659 RepID=A0A8J4DV49_9ACTN|nr:hypothetical protein Val02_66830 [Virgisporangium aliadipatigenens]